MGLLDELRAKRSMIGSLANYNPGAVAPRLGGGGGGDCDCKGPKVNYGGPAFAGYASAGSITVANTGAGPTVVQVTTQIQGALIPRDSVIQLATSVTAVGGTVALARITNILVDGQPVYIGTNGIFAFALDMGNQNSFAQRLGLDATRSITIEVTFGATSVIGDTLGFSIGRRGELSQQTAGCALP